MTDIIKCSIGILRNNNKILFSQRTKVPYLDMYEFPGGKINDDESAKDALIREIKEELSITVTESTKINKLTHKYQDFDVELHVFNIDNYKGQIEALEKQKIKFLSLQEVKNKVIESTYRILKIISLPKYYIITKPVHKKIAHDLSKLSTYNDYFIRMRFNNKPASYDKMLREASKYCKINNIKLIIDYPYNSNYYHTGIHYNSIDLHKFCVQKNDLLTRSASCHTQDDIIKANELNLDFIILSPIIISKSSSYEAKGWNNFKKLSSIANMPVFALGGIHDNHMDECNFNNGYGLAGISNFWKT